MATLMLEGGADIRHIQEILGHVQLSTTEIYTHVSIDALKAVHTRCHPGATNTRHRSPTPTERSSGGSPTERSDGGSIPPPTVPPDPATPNTVTQRTVAAGPTPPDKSRDDPTAGVLLTMLDVEAFEEAGKSDDQLREPGGPDER